MPYLCILQRLYKTTSEREVFSQDGRFQAFGFEDKTEACEMRYQIEKAVKPYSLKTTTLCGDAAACDADDKLMGSPGISTAQKHLEPLPAGLLGL